MKILRMPVAEARKNLAQVLKASENGSRIKLTRYNKTLAGVVPKSDLDELADCEALKQQSARKKTRPHRRSPKK